MSWCKNCGGDGYTSEQPVCPACNGTGKDNDALPAARNRVRAIAEATKLPTLVLDNAEQPGWVCTTPQASSVSWALWVGREHALDGDATLVLVALAQHAAAALFSGDGYTYTTAADISAILHWPQHLVHRLLDPRYHVWPHVSDRCDSLGDNPGWRIPEDALNGNWLDRAARQTHYGHAADQVRR